MNTQETYQNNKLASVWNWIRSNEVTFGILLAVVVGVIAGFGAIVFRWLINFFQSLFFGSGANLLGFLGEYYIILLPAIGGLIVGLIVYFGAREAKGHGVPEVMEAVAIRGGRIRPRIALVKSLASAICIGSGGSVGREGPIVQIGASFGSSVGQWLHLSDSWVRTLVACGAAGGISATFNAPIGGVFFAMEIILGRFITPRFGFVVISSVVADSISRFFMGGKPSFDIVPYSMISYWEILPYAILGVLTGLVGVIFMRLLYKSEDWFDALRIPEYIKPVIGGIGVGLIGLYSLDLLGVGYGDVFWVSSMGVDQALMGSIALKSLVILFALKILATSLTIGSGGSGGVFAPSLFIGAMLGGAFGTIAHQLFPAYIAPSGAYSMVGMAALFAGVARTPITSIIMLFEMTRAYNIILPLMVTVIISNVVSRKLSSESIYTLKLKRRGVDISQLAQTSPMRDVTVSKAMTQNYPTVSTTMSVSELITKLRKSGHHGFPVMDVDGNFCGMVSVSDVEAAILSGGPEGLTVNDICSKSLIVAYPDQYLHDLLVKVGTQDLGRIPVVDRNNPKQLLGVIRRSDVIKAYVKAVTGKSRRKT